MSNVLFNRHTDICIHRTRSVHFRCITQTSAFCLIVYLDQISNAYKYHISAPAANAKSSFCNIFHWKFCLRDNIQIALSASIYKIAVHTIHIVFYSFIFLYRVIITASVYHMRESNGNSTFYTESIVSCSI